MSPSYSLLKLGTFSSCLCKCQTPIAGTQKSYYFFLWDSVHWESLLSTLFNFDFEDFSTFNQPRNSYSDTMALQSTHPLSLSVYIPKEICHCKTLKFRVSREGNNSSLVLNQVVIIQRQAPTLITNTQCYDILPFPTTYVGTNIVFKI